MPETHIGRIGSPPPQNFAPTLHPEWFEGKSEQWLARVLGVTQFGVNHLTLQPGAYSALRHWHEQEDEFVFVIEGELVLIDENGEHPLTKGMYVAFSDQLAGHDGAPADNGLAFAVLWSSSSDLGSFQVRRLGCLQRPLTSASDFRDPPLAGSARL